MRIKQDGKGQLLWKKAKTIIPGGNQLLSKRAERFLPDLWPAYYSRAKGCEVWDLDDNHYYDFAQMGVGSCILGYADEDVNRAVLEAVTNGSMCSLNCAEEVEFAEQLIGLHPWSQMARFARTGGEACSVAVRIARAASGKGSVAFCGYHGWHDWYLAANLSDKDQLSGQLIPGLSPRGLHRGLTGSAFPFQYNDLASFESLIFEKGDEIGVIIMEPERGADPEPGFLETIRATANRIGAVLIFDEVTSGFRMNLGGIHLRLGVNPDMAVFGKAISNGYPMGAVIGKRAVMEAAQETFISSTYWTERVGYASALATLEKMTRFDVPSHLVRWGDMIKEGLLSISVRSGVPIKITGIPPLIYVGFQTERPEIAQTYWTQEMLDLGFLTGSAIYTTYAYSEPVINQFLEASEGVFQKIKSHLDAGDLEKQLKSEVVQSGFKRLT